MSVFANYLKFSSFIGAMYGSIKGATFERIEAEAILDNNFNQEYLVFDESMQKYKVKGEDGWYTSVDYKPDNKEDPLKMTLIISSRVIGTSIKYAMLGPVAPFYMICKETQ